MDKKIIIGIAALVAIIAGIALFAGQDSEMSYTDTTPTTTEDPTVTQGASDPAVEPAPEPVANNTLVDRAITHPELSTLVTAVSEAGLVETLAEDGPFTVFAPANEAFADLTEDALMQLLAAENNDILQSTLSAHVVAGTYTSADLEAGTELTTLDGQTLTVGSGTDGAVMINNSQIIETDITADNGVIHIIDALIEHTN